MWKGQRLLAVCLVVLLVAAVVTDAAAAAVHKRTSRSRAVSRYHKGRHADSRAAAATPSSAAVFTNPILWHDLADLEVVRVNDTFYYSASTMHYSPGAPLLRSFDLVNWEYIGHSVPVLDFGTHFELDNTHRAYVDGIWASSLAYRQSNNMFYYVACIHGVGQSFMYTAAAAVGPWQKHAIANSECYYDAGLLVDESTDTLYVAFSNNPIHVAQLSQDGFTQVKSAQVFHASAYVEGSRFYQHGGYYYIFNTLPPSSQYIARARSVWGPYTTMHPVSEHMVPPVEGAGCPHQGALLSTQDDQWFYMGFMDAYPGGRIPAMAPVTWQDDWPVLTTVNGTWGASYPLPLALHPLPPPTGTETFASKDLSAQWEWNHNPDNTRWSAGAGSGLTLWTASVTDDLYSARNTLTHRIFGPLSTATAQFNYAGMMSGDRAGLALFRDLSAYIGVWRDEQHTQVVFVDGLSMGNNWATTSNGTIAASATLPPNAQTIYLRITADIRTDFASPNPAATKQALFAYSTDGARFVSFGNYTMTTSWQFFMGYRFALFNYASEQLGGAVTVKSFTIEQHEATTAAAVADED